MPPQLTLLQLVYAAEVPLNADELIVLTVLAIYSGDEDDAAVCSLSLPLIAQRSRLHTKISVLRIITQLESRGLVRVIAEPGKDIAYEILFDALFPSHAPKPELIQMTVKLDARTRGLLIAESARRKTEGRTDWPMNAIIMEAIRAFPRGAASNNAASNVQQEITQQTSRE